MAQKDSHDGRKYPRFDTEVNISFHVDYDLQTKVKYEEIEKHDHKKYSAVSRNVSAEGLCFVSSHLLEAESKLLIEVYVPKAKEPVVMEGEVRWSAQVEGKDNQFATGVRLLTINGKNVEESIYFDEEYKLVWSDVLESTLGEYRIISQKRKQEEG